MLTRRALPGPSLDKRHQVHYWLEMLAATLGIYGDPHPVAIEAAPRHLLRMREWLTIRRRPNSKLVAVAPAAAYGPAKEWPQNHYAALVTLLAERGVQCVLVGGASEVERCESIAAAKRKQRDYRGRPHRYRRVDGAVVAVRRVCRQ